MTETPSPEASDFDAFDRAAQNLLVAYYAAPYPKSLQDWIARALRERQTLNPPVTEDDREAVRAIVDKFPVQEEFDAKECLIDELAEDRAAARAEGRREGIEEAATVADNFKCGSCGMDGKAGVAIRALAAPAGLQSPGDR